MRGISAVLLDIDGVLTVFWRPLPGAVEAVARLRAAGFALALVTNTTSGTEPAAGRGAPGGHGPQPVLAHRRRPAARRRAFLPGLEQASGVDAVVTGKPAAAFFATAREALGAAAPATVMVGDDVHADVLAAQQHGITGVLVRTGKFRPETLRAAPGAPTM